MKIRLCIASIFLPVFVFAQNKDIQLLEKININRTDFLDSLNQFFSSSAAIVAIGAAVLMLAFGIYRRSLYKSALALFVGFSVSLSAIISGILKVTIDRPRPFHLHPFIEKLSSGGSPSFPSGHTADAFSFATSISLIYPRWYVVIPAYTWAFGVAYSRMYLGVHFPSDVLGGAVLGLVSACIMYCLLRWAKRKFNLTEKNQ